MIGLLEERGVNLPFPYSSSLKRSELRELRIQSSGRPLRVAYAFDRMRQAVLLLGGDKTGDDRFYRRFILQSEQIWRRYLRDLGGKRS